MTVRMNLQETTPHVYRRLGALEQAAQEAWERGEGRSEHVVKALRVTPRCKAQPLASPWNPMSQCRP